MTSSNQKTSAAQVNFNLHSLRDDSENFNFQTKISDDKVGSGMREYLFFSRICLGVPSSNLGKAVEIKPVIIIKFKLIMIILSNLKYYKLVVI